MLISFRDTKQIKNAWSYDYFPNSLKSYQMLGGGKGDVALSKLNLFVIKETTNRNTISISFNFRTERTFSKIPKQFRIWTNRNCYLTVLEQWIWCNLISEGISRFERMRSYEIPTATECLGCLLSKRCPITSCQELKNCKEFTKAFIKFSSTWFRRDVGHAQEHLFVINTSILNKLGRSATISVTLGAS